MLTEFDLQTSRAKCDNDRTGRHGNDKLFCVIARLTAMSFPCLTRESNTRDLRVKPEDDREANSLMANWLYCMRDGKGAKRPPQRSVA